MTPGVRRDGAARLLSIATRGLPRDRVEWGRAMRAELAAIDESRARRRFARSAAASALLTGIGGQLLIALVLGLVVAVVTVAESRVQLTQTSYVGVLAVTVPIPALLLLGISFITALGACSLAGGLRAGALGMATSLLAVAATVALEGLIWIDRRGVFPLDGDPPRTPVGVLDIALDLFVTGLWIGHIAVWAVSVLIGAGLGRLGALAWAAATSR